MLHINPVRGDISVAPHGVDKINTLLTNTLL
jgi:hypothetical protein